MNNHGPNQRFSREIVRALDSRSDTEKSEEGWTGAGINVTDRDDYIFQFCFYNYIIFLNN